MKPLCFSGAVEIAREISLGTLSAVECLNMFRQRVERHNPSLNAVVVLDWERALVRARAADEALARGVTLGPLHGVPMTVKESFDLAHQPTTWGEPAWRNNMALQDDVVVQRLEAAGAVVFGKTNVPLRLRDFQTHNELHGATHNPYDVTRTPGGSSGGAAAALAAGLTGLELGSDLGGSIRQPAHHCGVLGHKPSASLVVTGGTTVPGAAAPTDMAVAGPLARNAQDLEMALRVLAAPVDGRFAAPPPDLRSFRVCVWLEQAGFDVDRDLQDHAQRAVDVLARSGATISDRARPAFHPQDAHLLFLELLEAAANPGRPRAPALEVQRTRLREQWTAFFRDWDVVLLPVSPTPALAPDATPLLERWVTVNGTRQHAVNAFFWPGLASAAYLPSTAFPVGRTRGGLPVGLQAMANHGHDLHSIRFSGLLGRVLGGFVPPPGWD